MRQDEIQIGRAKISQSSPVVIAEAGVNHLGRMDYAERLVSGAATAGAAAIKFQTYKAEKLTTRDAPRFWSWGGEVEPEGSQFDSYSRLDSFDISEYRDLKAMCDSYAIDFLSTPFDLDSVDLLVDVGVKAFKIASCDITNRQLITYIASTRLPILLSTGASSIPEIRRAVGWIEDASASKVLIMHCTLTYPTPDTDANLRALADLSQHFPDHLLGFSDHTLGPYIAAASVLFGAVAVEKHFTFDKSLPLSADHWLSADQHELKTLVDLTYRFSAARGIPNKHVLPSEYLARTNARRSVVLARPKMAGERLDADDLLLKRPGTGIPAFELDRVIGMTVLRDLEIDHVVQWEDVADSATNTG